MAPRSANVLNTEILQTIKGYIQEFILDANNGVTSLDLESRRALEWIESDRPAYWQREERKASDAVGEARVALARCESTITEGEQRSCYDEKKQLDKAKRRLELCEQKIRRVKVWKQAIHKHVEELMVHTAKFRDYLDSDLVRGINSLDKMLEALHRYAQRTNAPASGGSGDVPLPTLDGEVAADEEPSPEGTSEVIE